MSTPPETPAAPPVLDYDDRGGATYRQDFWEGQGRDYEDHAERVALRRLLHPTHGQRLLELGAGFGRLSPFYTGYQQVILVDYARSQLSEARQTLGDAGYLYVAADIYRLPIAEGTCDAAVMVRVLHHFADVPAALAQIRATLAPGAVFILEFANKRNLKAMLRYALGRQAWSPYEEAPVEFVKLNFDFHPRYIAAALSAVGFRTTQRLPVSFCGWGCSSEPCRPPGWWGWMRCYSVLVG
ncbi:MAG: class I SAM-dependent methyltransferase [Anaerolineae bacterium]|nr:class I SAM-dependent methyltransferase [Anaerolineae bacterium]